MVWCPSHLRSASSDVQEWWRDAYHHWTIGRLASPHVDKASNKWLELAWSLCDPHKNTLLWLLLWLHAIFLLKRPSAMRLTLGGGKVVVVVLLPFTISWRCHKGRDQSINLTNNGRMSLFLVWNSLLWGFKYGAGGSGGQLSGRCFVRVRQHESLWFQRVTPFYHIQTINHYLEVIVVWVHQSFILYLLTGQPWKKRRASCLWWNCITCLLCCAHHRMLHTML